MRRKTGVNNAARYKGNGRFAYVAGNGSIMPRDLTDEERAVEQYLMEKYGHQLCEMRMRAGTNMGRPIWMIDLADGREVETNLGPHELEGELLDLFKRNNVEFISKEDL